MDQKSRRMMLDGMSDPDYPIDAEYPPDEKQPPRVPPEVEALRQMLSEALNREMLLRVEIVQLRRQSPKAA